ncbi:hypothetical protein DERP_008787 [Dermatophagoides pteronyssinus]|uniref:Uncharacterized protein n=1 Tax=Dermatophagoides pteronyssinus TaxID=6956 RepID=A0ABQ8IWA3_DERPT|nr:hypothetical protein DERP_008787 [Dermatophagoides pteronyssinus]
MNYSFLPLFFCIQNLSLNLEKKLNEIEKNQVDRKIWSKLNSKNNSNSGQNSRPTKKKESRIMSTVEKHLDLGNQ